MVEGHYCGLCNLEGLSIPRSSETIEEFRAHVLTHDPIRAENARMIKVASSLFPEGPSGCWCVCHLGSPTIARTTCEMESTTDRCGFCERVGADRFKSSRTPRSS